MCAYLVVSATAAAQTRAYEVELLSTGFLLMAGSFLLLAEAILAYIGIRSWGTLYHGQYGGLKAEASVAFGVALMTVLSSSALYYVIASRSHTAFNEIQDAAGPNRLGNSIYYSLGSLYQFNSPDPVSATAKAAFVSSELAGIIFIVAVIALVLSAVSTSRA